MKLRTKIALRIIPIMFAAIVLMNLSFGVFFQDFVNMLEKSQVSAARESLASYIGEKLDKYTANANDWGHWDDTYFFVLGENDSYLQDNITESTFDNLDLNFMIFTGQDGSRVYETYYDMETAAFSSFPEDFMAGFDVVLGQALKTDDLYGLYRFGESFYFTAATDITDSNSLQAPAGKMLIGRKIDGSILAQMEKISGSTLGSISQAVNPGAEAGGTERDVSSAYSEDGDAIHIEITVPNAFDPQNTVLFSMIMPRTLFLMGRDRVVSFSIGNTVGSVAIALAVFMLLGYFLTRPFMKLTKDVQSIDMSKKVFDMLPEAGKDEFAYLRQSINGLLQRIEQEHRDVMESREKLSATLLSVGDGVLSVDVEGRIQFINPVAEKLTGWQQSEALGRMAEDVFVIINEFTRETVASPIRRAFELDQIVELQNHTLLIAKDGKEVPIEDTASPIRDMHGDVIGCVLVFRDFSERKEKQRRIEYLSYHDQLTGLFNSRFFDDELKRLDTQANLPLSFLYADVNGLKTFNDAFGHDCGNEMIQMVAQTLQNAFRPGDTVARLGGDEFVVLLPGTGEEETKALVKRLREDIKKRELMNVSLSVSFGWSTKTRADQSALNVMKTAEDYMYREKISNKSALYDDTIRSILGAVFKRNPEEKEHAARVSELCALTAKAFGLGGEELEELKTAGEVHDIGKIAIDPQLLGKREELSEADWDQIKRHPETGYRLLNTSGEYYGISESILYHHERWDGTGYPRGLKGEKIPWNARVLAIAEAYDIMVSGRAYRKALSRAEAAEEIARGAGTQFDPVIAEKFIEEVVKL